VRRDLAAGLSVELRAALEPEIESLNQRIAAYDRQIEQIAKKDCPEVSLLQQVKGVGTLIALTYVLTLEDPHRFRRSRDVGCYLGLRPGRRNSGSSQPQLHISKEGDRYLRTLMVQGRTTFWGRLDKTVICGDGGCGWLSAEERMPRNERSLRWRESWPSCFTSYG
jgi:transposase